MGSKFTLGRQERLKSRKLIEELFSKGKSFTVFPLRVIWLPAGSGLQMGAGVSAKVFRRAVDRNRIKRLIREAYRLQKQSLEELLQKQHKGMNVFFNCIAKEVPEYKTVKSGMQKALEKLNELVIEAGAANT